MQRILLTLLYVVVLGAWNPSHATHVAGADISYTCLGNNQYQVTLNVYRDCEGINSSILQVLQLTNGCNPDTASTLVFQSSASEVSQLCPSELPNSSCSGGALPGMEIHTYSGTVTVDPSCPEWRVHWALCCRNGLVLNVTDPTTVQIKVEAVIHTDVEDCDNSPVFTNQTIPYVCVNEPVSQSFGVTEPDGDSLSFALVDAQGLYDPGFTPLEYEPGYTGQEPIPGITIDTQTGLLEFLPTQIGTFVVVVKVFQWNENGELIGTTMRDVQFVVIACNNVPPDAATGVIENITGDANQIGDYAIEMCETDQFCFDLTISDPDGADLLEVNNNILQVLPGATVNWSGQNPITGQVCWTAPIGSQGYYSFVVHANDNGCPIFGSQAFAYSVDVLDRTVASPDQSLCGSGTADLQAFGGSVFQWEVVSGEPITVDNFGCTTCATTWASPSVTTTYAVTSDLSSTCINTDTVTVFVSTGFAFDVSQDVIGCAGSTVEFDVSVNPGGPGYEYQWSPSNFLNADNIPDPVGTFTQTGTFNYTVTITDGGGCVQDTTVTVVVNSIIGLEFSATQQDQHLCLNGTTQFFIDLGNMNTTDLVYEWTPGGDMDDPNSLNPMVSPSTFPAVYTFTVEDTVTNCSADTTLSINLVQDFSALQTDDVLCQGGSTQFFGIYSGTNDPSDITYTWSPPGDFDDPSAQSPLVTPTTFPAVYTLTAQDTEIGCAWDTTLTINLAQYFSAFQLDTALCLGDSTQFFGVYSGPSDPANINYNWTPPNDLDDPNGQNPFVTPTGFPSSYTLNAEDSDLGCTWDTTFTIGQFGEGDISFVPSVFEGASPLQVVFDNTSASGSTDFFWTFGDSTNTSTSTSPTFTFNEAGEYWVTLTGASEFGCAGTWQELIIVIDEHFLDIPNVFSPNGDGHNDEFAFLDFRGFRSFSFVVYNRWGQEVQSTSSVATDNVVWKADGDLPEGTYFYVFQGKVADGELVEREGNITLVR